MKSIKAQTKIYAMCVGLVIIILALALAPVISNTTERARNVTVGDTIGMDCTNDSISNFQKAGCVVVDLNGFYFVGTLILIGGGFIAMRILL